MWHSMMEKVIKDEGLARAQDVVMKQFELMQEDNPTWKITETKKQNIAMIVQHLPDVAVDVLKAHLQNRQWQRSALNTELVTARELRRDYCPSGCVGVWNTYLGNNAEVCVGTCELIGTFWTKALAAPEQNASKRDIASARPKSGDLEKLQIMSALWHNWFKAALQQRDPRLLPIFENKYKNLQLLDILVRVSQGKSSAALGEKLSVLVVSEVATELEN